MGNPGHGLKDKKMSIILGIDPGSRITGFGIIEATGGTIRHLDHGTIKTKTDAMGERLHLIYQGIKQAIHQYQPQDVSIEQVFFSRNPQSSLKVG